MKNTTDDLNNILFEQLERLNDGFIKGDELKEEIERSKAITSVADKMIANGALVLEAEKLKMEYRTDCKGPQLHGLLGVKK